jgi:Pentapeptide repeats (8 copies)
MGARFRSWWPIIRTLLIAFVIVIVLIELVRLTNTLIQSNGTGLDKYDQVTTAIEITSSPLKKVTTTTEKVPGKTLWDWLGLLGVLAIPVVVGLGAAWYTAQQGKESDRENTDNQREAALQAYIDKMSELLLANRLSEYAGDEQIRQIARIRTLTVLPRLDAERQKSVLRFLQESSLIKKDKLIVDLTGADIHSSNLSGLDLSDACLIDINLTEANLSKALQLHLFADTMLSSQFGVGLSS